jgi:amidase
MTDAPENWRDLAAKKRAALYAQIPQEWRLPSSTLASIHSSAPPTDPFTPATSHSSHSVLHVPRTCGILSERELELTEQYDVTALVEKMVKREATSEEVTRAFCKRAAVAQQCVNCLTEFFPERALERARECDAFLEGEGRPMGPLHGLPVSLKVSFRGLGLCVVWFGCCAGEVGEEVVRVRGLSWVLDMAIE